MLKEIPEIPILIDYNSIDVGAKKILEIIRPEWNNANIKFKIFTEGLSNKLIGYFIEPTNIIIIKIYGIKTEMIIDRNKEIETMKLLYKEKMGPELYAIFLNGIVYEYLIGKTLNIINCKDPIIYKLVAIEMGKLHSIKLENSTKSMIWQLFDKLNIQAELALTKNVDLMQRFEKIGIISGWPAKALKECKLLIEKENMPITFCHNDILLGNIVYNECKQIVSFIDYEYSGFNYAPFDISNHFCEFAGGPNNTDFSLCPDDNFKIKWIEIYLKNLYNGNHSYDLKTFLKWINICTPLTLLGWLIWGIGQTYNSLIDFDYFNYTFIRFNEYEKLMKILKKK